MRLSLSARRGLLIAGFWTVLGLFFTVKSVAGYVLRGDEARWGAALIVQMSQWYAWGILTPLLLWTVRRWPLVPPTGRSVMVHLGLGLVVTPVQVALAVGLRLLGLTTFGILSSEQASRLLANGPQVVLIGSLDSLVTYAVIVGLLTAAAVYRRYRERELRASQLEAQLAQAQLTALRMQLHPHFLFNTLHSISALVTEDPDKAERMIARLSDLLRQTLDQAGTHEVPLREELALLDHYLEIERIRFADRLTVTYDIDPATLDAPVPTLILQPLVENAVRYGIAPRATPGAVCIAAQRSNGTLRLDVRDDGPGLPDATAPPREGIGLHTTRARLERRYGDAATLDLRNAPEGGLAVTLTLPLNPEASPLDR